MRFLLLMLLTILITTNLRSQTLSADDQVSVRKFIGYVKHNRWDLIASEMSFPFGREYPIPKVNDSTDFMRRFKQFFDKELIKTIAKSNVAKDWSHVGWRGIMFLNGVLWLDEDGRLYALNHQTKFEVDLRQKLIKAEKATLHTSIQDYNEPICVLVTETYRIRIDLLKNQSYRYVCCNKLAKIDSQPDLVLMDGKINYDGSGGNHRYIFTSGEYRYEVDMIIMGETEAPDAWLTVFKNENEILVQPATLIRH